MAKLQLPSSARKARGLPVVETTATPTEISKKKRRKIEQLLTTQERRERNRQAISDRVDAMPIESAQQRLLEVKEIIEEITRDLLSYKKGVTDIPKMIESGLHPKEWAHRAGLARGYLLLERRLILNKLKPPKQEALDAEFNEIVRELESGVDVENNVIDNNPGNNS
jgi:uncharacterized membrane protein YheB (UPF0754 family)